MPNGHPIYIPSGVPPPHTPGPLVFHEPEDNNNLGSGTTSAAHQTNRHNKCTINAKAQVLNLCDKCMSSRSKVAQ